MKGSLAAFVTAIEALRRRASRRARLDRAAAHVRRGRPVGRRHGRGSSSGSPRAARRIDYCVVGEPSSVERLGDMIKNGRRGTLSGTLTVKGVQGHVAYPHLARNPIHALAPALAELAATRLGRRQRVLSADDVAVLEHPRRHRRDQRDSRARSSCMFNFRYSTASTPESLHAALRGRSSPARPRLRRSPGPAAGKPVPDAARHARRRRPTAAIRDVTGVTPELSCTGGTSDGRFIADICREVVELGPVNATIHKIDERVARRRPRRAVRDLSRHPRAAAAGGGAMSSPLHDLETLRDWLRYAVSRFGEAGVAFGHGTTNAYDEAAYLLLHALHLPLDRLEPFLDARLTRRSARQVAQLLDRRIDERVPAAYLTHEAWLGDFRFYVDERVIDPALVHRRAAARRARAVRRRRRRASPPRSTCAPARAASRSCSPTPIPTADVDAVDISSGRARRRAAQRRRLRARRPHQPDPLRPLRQPAGKELRPHHQQSAVRHRDGDGGAAGRVPARAAASRSPAATTASTPCA